MTCNEPLVSIGLPVYNAEKYLEEAFESILAQNYKHFELIVSDNASDDRTQDICLKYAKKDSRVRYYRNERNLGAAPNHNHVFKLAKGKYFKWAGYDDKIAPDFLTKCVEVLEKNLDIVLCMPQTDLIDENGQYIGGFDYKVNADISSPQMRFKDFMFINKSGNFIYGLMRLDSVSKTSLHGSFPSSDLVFLAELAFYGTFYVMPEPLFYRRMHAGQSTRGTLRIERNRVAWFDTSLKERIVLPKWRYLFACLKAVKNAPLNVFQRLYCYMQVTRWALMRHQIRALGKDVLLAARKLVMKLRDPVHRQKIQY